MFPIMAAQLPIAVYLPSLYAQHFGMPLGTVGTIFLVERIWGTFTDPIVGMLSDRTTTRFGRRKPWIISGSGLFAVATLLLFIPILKVTPLYLLISLFTFYLAWSMMFIPYLAWSGEISTGYYERTRIATAQTVIGAISLLLVLTLPTILDQIRPLDVSLKLAFIGGTILLSLAPTLLFTLRAFSESAAPTLPTTPPVAFSKTLRLVLNEGALLRVFLSDFAVSMGQGIRGTLIVFYVSFYIGLPKWASGLFLLQFVFGIAAGPIWARISKRVGKHRTTIAAELIQAGINCGLLLVMPGQIALLFALTVAQGLAQGSGNLMLRSMVADVADRHRLDTHVDRTALFFSVFSISQKAGMAAAVGVALPLVAWLGFNPAATTNSPEALRALALVFALGPAVAHVFSAAFIYGFPIDQARYGEIRRALDIRDALERE
jgi:Na+/melibiose symporter-like transporter